MTAERLDNGVCMITGSTDVCKTSTNGRFRWCLQRDANIVLYDGSTPYWASNTQFRTNRLPLRLCMQADGNLVAYDNSNAAFWASNTCCQGRRTPVTAFIQNDGNVVAYDATCSAFWSSNSMRATAAPPACSPSGSNTRVALVETSFTTGPYGWSGNPSFAFDDTALASGGSRRITQVNVRSGPYVDAIQFVYGTTATPWRGGSGGTSRPSLILAADELITQAWIRSGAWVDEIRFFTNRGRYWSSTGDTTQSGDWGTLASPCPSGAYRLIAVRGIGEQFLMRIEFIWALVPGAQGPLASTVAQWSYLPGETPIFKTASNGQPQCLSRDGRNCIVNSDGFNLRMCADTLTSNTATCSASDGANDPLHWCSKARGALGLQAPVVPLRIVFFNVEVCNTGLAKPDINEIFNMVFRDPQGLKAYYASASAGRVMLDESNSAVFNLRLPCASFSSSQCDVWPWYNYVRDNPSTMGGRNLNSFQIAVFVAPETKACQDVGVGFASGLVTWIRAPWGSNLNVHKHEIGHNLGFPHAPDDLSNPMGMCERCIYNAVDQLKLGWSRSLPVVDWATFTGSTVINLPALSDRESYRDLGVVTIRLQTPNTPGAPNSFGRNLYLSYRVAKGQDIGLPATYNQATSVHTIGQNTETYLLAWPKTGQAYVNTANRMVVRQDSGDAAGARVTLCKYNSNPSECGSFANFVRSSVSAASTNMTQAASLDDDRYAHKHKWQPAFNTTAASGRYSVSGGAAPAAAAAGGLDATGSPLADTSSLSTAVGVEAKDQPEAMSAANAQPVVAAQDEGAK